MRLIVHEIRGMAPPALGAIEQAARLPPVLDTLRYIRHETRTWLEITTLLIPGANDSEAELRALPRWVAGELGSDVPLHFTVFHPDWKLTDRPPTPVATLRRAREIARDAGLRHVYLGNVRDPEGSATYCPRRGLRVIERDGYRTERRALGSDGCCTACGTPLTGFWHREKKAATGTRPVAASWFNTRLFVDQNGSVNCQRTSMVIESAWLAIGSLVITFTPADRFSLIR